MDQARDGPGKAGSQPLKITVARVSRDLLRGYACCRGYPLCICAIESS
jgi:hypothetical protein